jgi:hypothetical protein
VKDIEELRSEALEAVEKTWFIHSLLVVDQTDQTISLRLVIRSNLFVQAYLGELSGSLYFALIEKNQRIFGIDRVFGNWHIHPYGSPFEHKPLDEGLEPKPLFTFLARVEKILLENDLL